ncbi:MAG: hypothetical protein ACMUHM_09420 [Thermoplasmatota archaeon]
MNIPVLVIIYLVLPGIITFITMFLVGRKYLRSYRSLFGDLPSSATLRGEHFQKANLLISMLLPSMIYSVLMFILIMMNKSYEPFQEEFIYYAGSLLGVSCLLATGGMGVLYYRSIPDFLKDPRVLLKNGQPYSIFKPSMRYSEETRKLIERQTFTKHLALGLGPHSISVFTFLLCILVLTYSNVVGPGSAPETDIEGNEVEHDPMLNETHIEEVRLGTVIMGVSLVPSFLLFLFLPGFVKGPLSEKKVFLKRLFLMVSAQFPLLIGLVVSLIIIF